MSHRNRNIKPRARRVKYPGIIAAAAALGVTRIHLYYVLEGERKSPRIEASLPYRQIRAAVVAPRRMKGPA